MKKVLIVEDDPSILEVIKLTLEITGYDTEGLSDGRVTYQRVDEYRPHLIVLDSLLGGVDGRVICKNLKTQQSSLHIPILSLSAYPGMEKMAKDCLADDFLAKPFDLDDLIKRVKKLLGD